MMSNDWITRLVFRALLHAREDGGQAPGSQLPDGLSGHPMDRPGCRGMLVKLPDDATDDDLETACATLGKWLGWKSRELPDIRGTERLPLAKFTDVRIVNSPPRRSIMPSIGADERPTAGEGGRVRVLYDIVTNTTSIRADVACSLAALEDGK